MNIRTIQKLLLTFTVLLFVACEQEEHPQMQGTASLQLRIKGVEKSSMTRGVEDLNNDGTVSDLEMYVDGQKIYRLGVYLLEGNNVVASTELEAEDTRFSNGNSEATISFNNLDYSKTYELYAVANYGNYNGITANISDVDVTKLTTNELKVNASTSNICPSSMVYPLTLKQELKLNPGVNTVNGQLQRTYARLRINVRNQSGLRDMTIASLSFPNNFIQSSADLFTNGGTANVAPTVTSTNAITPFQADMIVPKINASGNVSETTIFDAYLLESNNGNYEYTITLKVEDIIEEVYAVSSTTVNNINNIDPGSMYVIKKDNTDRYLYATTEGVKSGTAHTTNGELDMNYIWRFNRRGSSGNQQKQYTIESIGLSGYFMQGSAIGNDGVSMVKGSGTNNYFTASSSYNSSYLRFQATNNYYLAMDNNTVYGHSGNYNQNRRNFVLQKVVSTQQSKDITRTVTVPIDIVNKEVGGSESLTAIKRNDFINILLNVSYNEETGLVEFEVSNWDEKNGEVTFD